MNKCLKHFKKIVNFFDTHISNTGDIYSTNSKKVFVESILLVIDNLNLTVSQSLKQKYRDAADKKAKSFDFSIISFPNYLKLNGSVFGKDRKKRIYYFLILLRSSCKG